MSSFHPLNEENTVDPTVIMKNGEVESDGPFLPAYPTPGADYDDGAPKAKKPATPRKHSKAAAAGGEGGEIGATNGDGSARSKVKKPATPRKRKSATATTEDDNLAGGSRATDDDSPTKKNKTPKKGPSKVNQFSVSTSADNISEVDKMILRMKDEGKTWAEIKPKWEEMTGQAIKDSTLRVRYMKLKSNITVFGEGDEGRLLETKEEVEADFEAKKWQEIARGIEDKGGQKYSTSALQKKFKELEKNGFRLSESPSKMGSNSNGGANGATEASEDGVDV